MAKVKIDTPKGVVNASQKRLAAELKLLEALPPNASANAKIEILTNVVIELSKQVTALVEMAQNE